MVKQGYIEMILEKQKNIGEWNNIESKMHVEAVEIRRIQNKYLWEEYFKCK